MRAVDQLGLELQAIADSEGGPMWGLGGPKKPERWWEAHTWRCPNEHVSTSLLGTGRGKVCLECGQSVWLTFPEDRDGPLAPPTKDSGGGR